MAQRSQQPAPSPRLDADKATALRLTPVSRETAARLDRYVELLLQWQAKTNLIAPSTLANIWTRHIADSLQLLALAPDAKAWIDIGSGGGFPGVVIACAMAEVPGAKVFLVERNSKKAAFLREALRVTSAPGEVILADIGDSVDRFSNHIGFAEPFLKQGSRGLFMKGQDVEAELTEAAKYWKLNPLLHPSLTGGKGWIVDIDHVDRHNPVRPSPHGVPNERN
jgi:16S rRNA (guanine527-N7)-methyltransferase